jgi:hypothetical protein
MDLLNLEVRSGEVSAARFSKTDLANLVFILALCGIFSYLRWVKMDTLVWGDPARWLFEAQRVAAGQTPYKDFSWPYPPLSVLLLGWMMKSFGVTFLVAQVFVDIVSLAVVLAAYFLVRLLLPRFLHGPVMFCLIAVCGTSLMFFNLFSFLTYVPALQTAAAGFLLFLIGVLTYVRTGRLKVTTWLAVTLGAFVAAYSKPESLLAMASTVVVLSIGDRVYWFAGRKRGDWLWHYMRFGSGCSGPALAAYLCTGAVAGFANMWAGNTGYGLARAACPWWPTGLGLFGAAASLGEAVFVAAALSLTRRSQFAARFGRNYYRGLAVGFAGACLYSAYVLNSNWDLLTGNRPLGEKVWYSAHSTVWTSAILLPVMWSCVVLWFYLVLRLLRLRGEKPNADFFMMLVLLTGPVAMSSRGWFNWSHEIRTDVPGICYPFFLALAPYLMWRLLTVVGSGGDLETGIRSRSGAGVAALMATYGLLRVVAAYPSLLSNGPYHDLSTIAGNVRVTSYAGDSEIYRFVVENTSPGDSVLDIPYGGGINFAAHRLSPLFATQFRHWSMADKLLEKDVEGLHRRPPKVVIANNEPNYGAVYGLQGCTCAFPRLVWAPGTSSVVPDKVFPAFVEIKKNYRVAKVVGRKLLLVPK